MFDFTHLDLNFIWFILIGILFGGYAILDGFDLGIGGLHLFTKTDEERRLMINSIGPVWDGNEVWLVTSGGALFAAFPEVYATLISGFYTVVMMLLFSLIFRAVAIEFRGKEPMPWWRKLWDTVFSLSSLSASFVFGMALGNLIWGIPLGEDKNYTGGFFDLIHPYSILTGLMTVSIFIMHGSIYLALKTEGEFHEKARGWVRNCIILFVVFYIITTMATLIYVPDMAERLRNKPALLFFGVLPFLAILSVMRAIYKRKDFLALVSSAVAILSLLFLFAIGIFPYMVLSRDNISLSLTIYNSASSLKSLNYMFIIALLTLPFVLCYTITVYWIFRGKVKISKDSY